MLRSIVRTRILGVIPARFASSRFPGKALTLIAGKPMLDPFAVDAAALALLGDEDLPMATLAKRIEDPSEIANPNVVKVVSNLSGDAIYFSRCPIPYMREGSAVHYKHIGIYAYRRDFLLAYSGLPVGPLERVERLEQLRALENGYRIRVVETEYESLGVDTPEDLERVAALFEPSLSK